MFSEPIANSLNHSREPPPFLGKKQRREGERSASVERFAVKVTSRALGGAGLWILHRGRAREGSIRGAPTGGFEAYAGVPPKGSHGRFWPSCDSSVAPAIGRVAVFLTVTILVR